MAEGFSMAGAETVEKKQGSSRPEQHSMSTHLDDIEKAIAVLAEGVGLVQGHLESVLEPQQEGKINADAIVAGTVTIDERPKSEALRRLSDFKVRLEGLSSRLRGLDRRIQL